MNFDKLFKEAKAAGIEDIQIFYVQDEELEIEVFKGEVEKYTIANTASLSAKGIYNGKMGTVSTEQVDDSVIEFIISSIIDSAKYISSEDEVFIYEGDKSYTEVEGLFNPDISQVGNDKKIADTKLLEVLALKEDERAKMVQAFYGESTRKVLLQNSKGLKLQKEVNNGMMGVYIIASDGKDQRTGIEYIQSNDYNDYDLNALVKGGVKKAVGLLGATACESGEYEILLENEASASLLAAYVSMFSAEMVQKDVSLLKGKLGKIIGNDKVTIVDDPFMKKSVKSGSFDDEGVKTEYKEVVANGKLTTFLHNLKTAKKDNVKSTGNAFGRGIAPTNFYFKNGTSKKEDIIKGMKKGLFITGLDGTHAGTNAISGDFSLQAKGYLVKDGKIESPVALITVAGNYLDVLNDVLSVCDDLKFGFNYIGSPSLHLKSLAVSGK
ncbi:MAG: TldD/PmbA family protein [Candidatus Izemoplasma sp.]